MSSSENKVYEHLLLLQHSTPAQEVVKVVDAASRILSATGGIVVKHEIWGLRDLAYKIARCSKAHFVLMHANCTPEAHKELCSKLALNPDVIRGFSRKLKAVPSGSSPVLLAMENNDSSSSLSAPSSGNQMGQQKHSSRGEAFSGKQHHSNSANKSLEVK